MILLETNGIVTFIFLTLDKMSLGHSVYQEFIIFENEPILMPAFLDQSANCHFLYSIMLFDIVKIIMLHKIFKWEFQKCLL